MDSIGFIRSMEKNHLMEDAGNVNGEVKKVSFILAVGLCVLKIIFLEIYMENVVLIYLSLCPLP